MGSHPIRKSVSTTALMLALGVAGVPAVAAVRTVAEVPRPAATGLAAEVPPLTPGRHVYDDGARLSAGTEAIAERLAAGIEELGGGRVVVYSTADTPPDPAELVAAGVDGLALVLHESVAELAVGDTLGRRLDASELGLLGASSAVRSDETWLTSTLARVEGMLRGGHVFDGSGSLTEAELAAAEEVVVSLGQAIGGPVYVDIALSSEDPETDAFFGAAGLIEPLDGLIIGLAVRDQTLAGYLGVAPALAEAFHTAEPWELWTLPARQMTAPVGEEILTAIKAVRRGSGWVEAGGLWWIIALPIGGIALIFLAGRLWGDRFVRGLSGVPTIKDGVPGRARIEALAETGVTISTPSVGPDAPRYLMTLLVTPQAGPEYRVKTMALVPRIYLPVTLPGATIPVLIDPSNPQRVVPDWTSWGSAGSPTARTVMDLGGALVDVTGSAPDPSQLAAVVSGVRRGAIPRAKASASALLATGTVGTAVITAAQPLGMTARDLDPDEARDRLDDPIWAFTLEVTLPGEPPFPAAMGQRVPRARVAEVVPGARLTVAVNEAAKHSEVAIDWDRSPLR